ncbi:hypothetical protein EKO27_g5360 [Xylaria grammica]|uniref:Uncharacterized protein n=1 Tax=Xylaria grammica TaxID=363999 RepID=A0A439D5S5_9PEZI|nr:hypothetical protein EKO27_g5360 [Xylaria grammica]
MTKKDLQEEAEKYMRSSKGKIRTVVGAFMREMYLAELRNEERLEESYLHNELDATESYSYKDDERNTTGKASILVWRAETSRNGNVKASCYQDEVFRDETGNAVELCSLRLPLQDFICQGLLDSPEGKFEAPLLEISSKHLCSEIVDILKVYRRERAPVIIEKAENKKKKQLEEAAEMELREEQGAVELRFASQKKMNLDVAPRNPGISFLLESGTYGGELRPSRFRGCMCLCAKGRSWEATSHTHPQRRLALDAQLNISR